MEKNVSTLCFSQDITGIIPEPAELLEKYLVYFLKTKTAYFNLLQRGATIQGITREVVESLNVPLPPIEEQKHIVAILDKADAIRKKRQETIRLADEFLRSMFLEMFGDPVRNEKGWEKQPLGDCCRKITDGTHKTPSYVSNGVKFISARNIQNGRINWVDTKFISLDEHQSLYKRCNPEFGDVLLTKSGSIGSAALIDIKDEFSLFESLALIKQNREILLSDFLVYYLNSESVSNYYAGTTKGISIKHLHLNEIAKLPTILPTIDVQRKFTDIVNNVSKQRRFLENSLFIMENNFIGIMQQAFRGEL